MIFHSANWIFFFHLLMPLLSWPGQTGSGSALWGGLVAWHGSRRYTYIGKIFFILCTTPPMNDYDESIGREETKSDYKLNGNCVSTWLKIEKENCSYLS